MCKCERGREYEIAAEPDQAVRFGLRKKSVSFVLRTVNNIFRSGGIALRPPGGEYAGLYATKISISQLPHRDGAFGKKVPHESYFL